MSATVRRMHALPPETYYNTYYKNMSLTAILHLKGVDVSIAFIRVKTTILQ